MSRPDGGRARVAAVLACALAGFAGAGCGALLGSGVRPVPVAETDSRGTALERVRSLRAGDRGEQVAAILGEPADRQRTCMPVRIVWRYPLRAWNDMAERGELVPAALLRLRFDDRGTLADWGFVDPRDGRALPVRETAGEAARWFRSLSHAPPPVPPRIDLIETLVRGRTTLEQVERALGRWHPDLLCGNGGPVPLVRKSASDSGSVWDWYVDRPSRLFIPPRYLVAAFDEDGTLIGTHFEQTYPGGRK